MSYTLNMNINQLPELLTPQEVADLFRVSKLTISRWEKRGHIKSIRVGPRGDKRFKKKHVLDIFNNGNQSPVAE